MKFGKIHIGARMLKTGLAVFLCLLINLMMPGTTGVHSCIAAVICMMPTSKDTLRVGGDRAFATVMSFVGGAAILSLYSLMPNWYQLARLILMPLFIILLIFLCQKLKRQGSVLLCCAIFIMLALGPAMSFMEALEYSTLRLIDTLIGIAVAWLVNRFIYPSEKYHPEKCGPSGSMSAQGSEPQGEEAPCGPKDKPAEDVEEEF